MDGSAVVEAVQGLPPTVSIVLLVVFAVGYVAKIVADTLVAKSTAKSAGKKQEEMVESFKKSIEDVRNDLKLVRLEASENHKETMENQVVSLRYDIISYADQIKAMQNPTVEHFDIFEDLVDRYVKLSEKYKIRDGKVIDSIRQINHLKKEKFNTYIYTVDTIERYEEIIRGI